MKAYVLSYPKMWYFLGLAVFKVELLAPEVGSKFKKKTKAKRCQKNKHGQNFIFFTPPKDIPSYQQVFFKGSTETRYL